MRSGLIDGVKSAALLLALLSPLLAEADDFPADMPTNPHGQSPNPDSASKSAKPRQAVMLPPPSDYHVDVKQVIGNENPFSAEDIAQLRSALGETKRAAATGPVEPPRPVTGTITANLAPGATPIVVRTSIGYGASISFIDSTGAPWPIDSPPHNFAPLNFKVLGMPSVSDKSLGSVITITALSAYQSGSLSVLLKNIPFPIPITLVSGQKEVDSRLDIRIPMPGPNAAASDKGDSTPGLNSALLPFLNGMPPDTAKQVKSSSPDVLAWMEGDVLVIKTGSLLLAPAYKDSVRSADGMAVYSIQRTPVVTLSDKGAVRRVSLELTNE